MGALDNMLAGKRQEKTTAGALDRMIEASKQEQTGTQTAPRSVAAMRKSAEYRPLKTAEETVRTTTEDTSRSGEKADTPTLGGRLKRMASGAGKQYVSGYANLAGLGQTGTTKRMRSEAEEELDNLEREITNQRTLLNDRNASEADRESARTMIESMEKKADAYRRAYGAEGENEKTAAKLYETADRLAVGGARDVQEAKRGLGKAGSLAVDAGVGGMQLGADILLGLPTGGAMLPMALRSAGGAAQEARQEGASHEQQTGYGMAAGAISVLTEDLSNAAKPLAKVFGKGIADDMVDQAVKSLAARLAKTPAGRTAAQALLKTGVSALGEGFEEMAEDAFDVAAKWMIYDPTAELDVGEMLYDGLVGGTIGGVLGLGGEIVGARGEYEKYRLKTAEELAAQKKAAPTAESGVQTETAPKYLKTVEEMAAEKNAASKETAKDTYRMIAHDDGQGQAGAALNAYNKVIDSGKSVVIPDEIVAKYEQINADPLAKLKNVVKEYYEKHLKGQSVDVDINGGVLTVKFENDGMKKSVGWRMKPDKAATFEQLLALTGNSEYAYSSTNRDANEATSIPRFHYYMADAQIGEQHVPVKIQIRDINTSSGTQESHYYYHNLQNNKGNDSPGADTNGVNGNGNAYVPSIEPSARTTTEAVEPVNAIDNSVDTTVPQSTAGVNAQDMQGGAEYAQEGPRYLKTAEELAAEKETAGKSNYNAWEADAIRREGKTFRNLVAGFDTSVSAFFDKWSGGRKNSQGEKLEKLYLGMLTDAQRKTVGDILGYPVSERNVIVTNNDVRHILREHGSPEAELRKGNLPLERWAIDALPEVVTQPDSITPGEVQVGGKNDGKRGVLLSKSMPDGKVVTVQFDNKGRGTMEITTMYVKENSGDFTQTLNVEKASPQLTAEPESGPVSPAIGNSIPSNGENVKRDARRAEYAQEGPRYLKTAEELAAERAAAEAASYRQAEQSGEGYMDALARDENLFEEPLTLSDRIYAMKLDELQTREAPPEKSRTDVEKRDVDELAELYAAAANPVSTARDARFEASQGLVKAKTAEERKTAKDRAEDARSFFMRKMVDAGDSVTRVAKATGDRYLYPYYNMARSSASAGINMIAGEQTDVTGKRVGKSLNDIFQPIRKLGDDYYNAFQLYLFDLHNADRMSLVTGENTAKLEAELALKDFDRNNPDVATLTEERLRRNASDADPDVAELAKERLRLLRRVNQADRMGNKPVFSYEVTADMSRERADRLVREHPEFEQYRAEVRKYIDNLMQYRVDSGLMTQEDAAFLKRYYPNYVPTFRAVEKGGRGRDRRSVQIGKTVGRAEGGTQKLVPLHEALGKQTMSVVREGSKNRFGQRLLDDYMNSRTGSEARRYVRDAQEFDADFSAETFDQTDPTPRRENTFSVYKDGKKWDMTVDESMFDAVKALSPDAKESSVAVTAIRSANNLFKSLVTGYNPTFLVRNTIRDLQTAGLYSRDGKAFAQNYPLALKEIRTNGEYWKQYKALGGSFSSVFDYRTGTVKEQTGKATKLLGKLEALNMATEQAPRLAEFMSVVKAGDGSMSNLMDAMHAAADVTVNFGRAGTLGKVLNANFVPFLNPGIQGFDKMIRRVTETQGAREWASLVVRAAVLGIAPTLINAALYSDDDEWDDIRDSDKDTNYLFKLGDGVWLKIPKGRELSLLGMTADRIGDIVNRESVDWRDFITTAGNQVAPANPLKSNIFSAYADADLFDPSSPGKTWYGGDIESQRLRKYAPGERYDSSTDVVSKWIGEQLGLSPKKINYLLDQYTGVVGDFVLPLLTPQAERGMFEKAFTLDSVSNNRISGEFYDESDKLTYAKNGGDDAAAVVSRFWSKQAAACAGIYAEIRKTENSNLTNAEKKQKVREAKAVLNGIQKNALALEETYQKAAEKAVRETNDTDDAYREANRECFGAEYALEVYNKDVYAKAKEAHEGGIEYDTYYDYYFAAKELKADKDRNGKTITGSKREKVLKLIDSMELSDYQKDVLYLTEGYSEKTIDDAPWNQSEYEKYRLKLPKYELPEYELPKYELEVKLLPRP